MLKPWILPTGNDFIKDPAKRHVRPAGDPGGDVSYVRADFDDRAWQPVTLPHDWAIAGPFLTEGNHGGMGRLPSWGIGWYRRSLDIPAADAGKSIFLEVDGAMSYAVVWLNGRLVGGWPYGYASWRVDLTPYVMSEQAYADYCQQNGQEDPQAHHAPCHACRIGAGADLPPTPCVAVPAFVEIERTAYAEPLQPVVVAKVGADAADGLTDGFVFAVVAEVHGSWSLGLEGHGQACAAVDGTQCIEFGGQLGAADDLGCQALAAQGVGQRRFVDEPAGEDYLHLNVLSPGERAARSRQREDL